MTETLLDVRNLSLYLDTPDGDVQILDDVSFTVERSTTVGMIGESGSGKSMTALAVLGLLPPRARVTGEIRFRGTDLLAMSRAELARLRGTGISMIFQEPMTALDPVFTIGQQISQVLRSHRRVTRREAREKTIEMLDAVGIPDPARRSGEYPHQLSGGMRQRAMIAMALIGEPELLIADEPTTAVDITIQAQLLDLLETLGRERGTSIMLISHDIGVVAELCRRVVVLYAGQVVEATTTDALLERPGHPYTSGLMWAVPRLGTRRQRLHAIRGRVPQPDQLPTGCRFRPRCDFAVPECAEPIALAPVGDGGPEHDVRCRRADELDLPGLVHDGAEATVENAPVVQGSGS
ncbi:ABC transporter ATP-binding protein [Pseudonocardia humida]|uniref:ABC transporter ATP-binding protein n=1 Tax=Pseudonocardia humida TaxID=2800819 RepID=A0ABT1A200_9PSEU|nr:ABC transporter ATP-binding protein [Pseudonocardia humida]MCO1657031.1 ABC transporter ATP-binding protein [Pseudonocardia humida]